MSNQYKVRRKNAWFETTFDATAVPLLVFMTFWVFILPASFWVGWWPGYEARMHAIAVPPHVPVPRNIITKYANLPDVKLTHIIPSGIWAACGAIQLTPRLRTSAPHLHRLSGRLLMACSALIVAGYVLMEIHGIVELGAEEPPPGVSEPGGRAGGAFFKRPAGHLMLRVISLWFVATAVMAWRLALQRRYAEHRRWAVRHMAAGGWVIVQRVMLAVLAAGSGVAGASWSDAQRLQLFSASAVAAIAVTLPGTELLLRRQQNAIRDAGAWVNKAGVFGGPAEEGGEARKSLKAQ